MSAYRIRVRRDTLDGGGFEWAALDGKGAVRESGSATLEQNSLRGACELVLAADLVLLDRLAVPAAQQRRLGGSLRFLAEEAALPDPERLHVAAEAFPAKDSLGVAIVDRQWLKDMLARLARAGLVARSALPESVLPPLEPGTWCVVCNGPESFVRVGEVQGFALDSTRTGEVPVALKLAVANGAPERIIVRAAPGMTLPDARRWSAVLGVPVEHGAPWQWAEAPRGKGLELLQREFAPRGAQGGWRARARRPALLAAAVLAVLSLGIAVEWWVKAREQRELLGQMHAIYRETFGESAVIVDAPLQMQRALADLRLRSGEAGPGDFLPLLGRLTARLVDPERHRVESIDYERGTLRVTLRAHDAAQLAALRAELNAGLAGEGLQLRIETLESSGRPGLRLRATAEGTEWTPAKR